MMGRVKDVDEAILTGGGKWIGRKHAPIKEEADKNSVSRGDHRIVARHGEEQEPAMKTSTQCRGSPSLIPPVTPVAAGESAT